MKDIFRDRVKSKGPKKPQIPDELYGRIIREIKKDNEAFLVHYGKPKNYWASFVESKFKHSKK
ncbi:MAG: hypothetical protein R6U03_13070 [Gillisia sp.]